MSNAEVTSSNPALVVKDVEGMMEELSRQLPPPEGGRLRGEPHAGSLEGIRPVDRT